MSEQQFEVVFRGDVEPGQSIVSVKEGLAKLFNAEASRIDQMFTGKPVVIKANLDEDTARHYQSSLAKVGALADIRPVKSEGPNETSSSSSSDSNPPASDSLDSETAAQTSCTSAVVSQDTQEPDGLENFDFDFDVAPVGADVLPSDHKKDFTPADVDTSHLSVSDVGTDVLEEKDKRDYEDRDIDTSHLSVDDLEDSSKNSSENS